MSPEQSPAEEKKELSALELLLFSRAGISRELVRDLLIEQPGWRVRSWPECRQASGDEVDDIDVALLNWGGSLQEVELARQVITDRIPLLVVGSRSGGLDILAALAAGATDVIERPNTAPSYLCERVRVAFIRTRLDLDLSLEPGRDKHVGPFRFRVASQTLTVGGDPVELTPNQWRLLWCLAEATGRTVRAEELCQRVGIQDGPHHRNLQNEVWRLRERLGAPSNLCLQTVRGAGYRLIGDPLQKKG